MADTKIKTSNIESLAVTHDKLHTNMDLTGKTVQVPTPTAASHPATKNYVDNEIASVTDFAYNGITEVLTIDTADGSSFTADISTLASQTYVDTAVSNLVDSAPGTLDTLNELAAALGDDANFATTVSTNLGNKVDKIDITGATVGSASAVPVITFNAQGQITSASTTAVAGIDTVTFSNGSLTISTGDGTDYTTDFDARYFTETEANANFLGINAKAADADTLDGLNSTQFLRSDADDTTTGYIDFSTGLRAGEIAIGGVDSTSDSYNVNIKTINDNPLYLQYDSGQDVHIGQSSNPVDLIVSGNVGIGTDNPTRLLDISKTDATQYDRSNIPDDNSGTTIRIINNDTANGPSYSGIHLQTYGASANIARAFIGVVNDENWINGGWSGTHHHLTFASRTSNFGNVRETMILTSDGNLGIGEDWGDLANKRPMHKLDVDGAIATRQVRHSIRPTLNLDFANSKELDPRITFYRESIATYYDSKGVLRYANVNKPRFDHDPVTGESKGLLIEEERTNILTHSDNIAQSLSSSTALSHWHARGMTVETNILAPDGTMSAIKVTENGTNNNSGFVSLADFSNGSNQTFSVWLKSDTDGDTVLLSTAGSSAGSYVTLTTEWKRYSVTQSTDTSSGPHIGGFGTVTQGGGQSWYVWGPQLEYGAFPTSYIPSDTRFTSRSSVATYYDENGILRTAPANSPRYGYKYDGRKWVETGLILEGAATNIAKNINYWGFEVSDNQARGSFTTDIPAPDGSYTATRFDFSGISSNTWGDTIWFPGVNYAGTTKTFSIWLKGTAGETVGIRLDGQGSNGDYNLVTLTGDWQREHVTYTYESDYSVNASVRVGIRALGTEAGTATAFYAWGAQLEEGFTMSSYIYQPSSSSSASVSRSADVASSVAYTRQQDIAYLDNIEDWNSEEEGTFYTEHQVPYDIEELSTNRRIIERHNFVGDNVASIIHNGGTDQLNAGMFNNSNWQVLMGVTSPYGVVDKNSVYKTAFAYTENDFALSVQGSPIATDTSGSLTYNNTRLQLGNNSAESAALCGHLKTVRFYPERLTNNELVALTENN